MNYIGTIFYFLRVVWSVGTPITSRITLMKLYDPQIILSSYYVKSKIYYKYCVALD